MRWPHRPPAARGLRRRAPRSRKLTRGRTDIGAVVTFTGICRGDEAGAPLAAMTLEHYPGMAEAEIARHVEAAEQRWPLLGVTVDPPLRPARAGREHRARGHRRRRTAQAAFAAAEFLMDYLKTRAPFWKQVEYAGGKDWVDAKQSDDAPPIAGRVRAAAARRPNEPRRISAVWRMTPGSTQDRRRADLGDGRAKWRRTHDPHARFRGAGAGGVSAASARARRR